MSRFQNFFDNNKQAFLPFFVCGFPDMDTSFELICEAVEAGANALELGIPFSDPIADGPVIQQAFEVALAHHYPLNDYFTLIAKIRARYPNLPIGLLVYSQMIERLGIDHFYLQAAQAGIDGILAADVPAIENQPYREAARLAKVDNILIAAPSCSEQTLSMIAKSASGFTYVVTRKGVTGNHLDLDLDEVSTQIERLQSLGAPPCVLGFGIQPDNLANVGKTPASGFIIGSYLVKSILDAPNCRPDMKALLSGLSLG